MVIMHTSNALMYVNLPKSNVVRLRDIFTKRPQDPNKAAIIEL